MLGQLQDMGVSKNNGTPKSSILIGFSIVNHPFWDTPIFGNTHMFQDVCDEIPCFCRGWGLCGSVHLRLIFGMVTFLLMLMTRDGTNISKRKFLTPKKITRFFSSHLLMSRVSFTGIKASKTDIGSCGCIGR